ncbi:DUF397 domain-containing protein [Nonomuraea sp. NPDC050663]|uniref:DUF397 domain-containing protein n=1 Tax=Nonomuraea sp. NPDC050663 TaxID=3364370 RepID=UPI00378AF96B
MAWRKSSFSLANGECVEVARLSTGDVVVRHSKDPEGAMLHYSAGEWTAFVAGVIKGEFDLHDLPVTEDL